VAVKDGKRSPASSTTVKIPDS
ncbi:hypothetical protein, partial [Listeria monocytogenes]